MSTLNANVPGGHFYAYVRQEYLYNLEAHHGEWIEAAVFGVQSREGEAISFHAVLKNGALFSGLPLCALAYRLDAPTVPLPDLELWDCFGYDLCTIQYDYLRHLDCRYLDRHGQWHDCQYVFTIEWLLNGFSDEPSQRKSAHLLKRDDGNYAAQPNNRILWTELSFTKAQEGWRPDYRVNTHTWYAEADRAPTPGLTRDADEPGNRNGIDQHGSRTPRLRTTTARRSGSAAQPRRTAKKS